MGRQGRPGRFAITTVVAVVALVAAIGCDSDPAGPVLQIEGTYGGNWVFDVFLDGSFSSRAVCPGSITLAEQQGRTYGGAFVVRAEGDCTGISPISGEIVDGAVRGDGGVNFGITRIPVVGSGVAGCTILVDPEAGGEMNGAVAGGELSAFTTAGLDCGDRGQGAAQITMTGTR